MFQSRGQQGASQGKGQHDTDWAVCVVRWMLIAAVPLLALFDPAHGLTASELISFVSVAGAYNLAITILLLLRLFPSFLPLLTMIIDTAGIVVLLHLSGGIDSPFSFFALLPILTASLRLGWEFGLVAAGLFVLSDIFRLVTNTERELETLQLFAPVLQVLPYLLAAVVGGALSLAGSELLVGKRHQENEASLVPDRVKLVYEMASSLSATLNYERVLDAILDISRLGFDDFGHRLGEAVGFVLLYDEDGLLSVVSHRNLYAQRDEALRIQGRAGIVEQAIATATALIGGSPSFDPELKDFMSLARSKSTMAVPLRAGFETYGAVVFASSKPNAYLLEHAELLSIFCNQATIALQNASLYQTLREERDKIIDQEEQARHKLARNLHDGPTQDVAAIAMRLNFARLLVERDPARAKAELARLEDLAHRTVREIRSMLFTLRPVILETEGLVAALNQYAENLRENDGIPVDIDPERYDDILDMDTQGVVFAILEEAINNAKKHADPSHIWVRLAVEGELFVAEVVDNGRGFDVEAVERDYGSRGSLGLINLKERADLVEGNINIQSTIGQGTRITLVVPITHESE